MSKAYKLRLLLAAFAVLVGTACIVATILIVHWITPGIGIENMPFNELASKSIDARLDLSRSLFQIALLITGVLWGLIIAKKDETKIVFAEHPEIIMFISGSVLLLLSLGSHTIYLNNVSKYLAAGAQAFAKPRKDEFLSLPNIFDQNVNYVFIIQVINLIAGICTAVITLVSAHRLKEK